MERPKHLQPAMQQKQQEDGIGAMCIQQSRNQTTVCRSTLAKALQMSLEARFEAEKQVGIANITEGAAPNILTGKQGEGV